MIIFILQSMLDNSNTHGVINGNTYKAKTQVCV
jgi:hypothetical protein